MALPRRRRGSSSSVQSIDQSKIQWRQEVSVVKTIPKTTPFDEWPTFELRDATVLSGDGTRSENALFAETKGPFIVRGRLIIDDPSQRTHLLMRVRLSVPIEIRSCINYSIGESEEGSPLIWILGKGGWYELSPSAAYKQTYRKMCEATTFYYKIIDIYADTKHFKSSKRLRPSEYHKELSDLFLKYTTRIGDGSTYEEVVSRCSEHAPFFISQFAQEDPSVMDWKTTVFYKWLTTKHSNLVKEAEEAKRNPRKLSETPVPTGSSPRPSARASRSTTVSSDIQEIEKHTFISSQQTARRPPIPPTKPSPANPNNPPKPLVSITPARVDDTFFPDTLTGFEEICTELANSKRGVVVSDGILNKLYFNYRFPTYKDGSRGSHKIPPLEFIHYNARALLDSLDKATYKQYEMYAWLQDLAQKPFIPVALKPSDFPMQLIPRKSALRASKQPAPFNAAAAVSDDVDMLNEQNSDGPRPRGKTIKQPTRRPGKSSLRLASSKKRPRESTDSDSDSESSIPRRSLYFSDGDDAMNDAPAHKDADELVHLVLRADKMPSTVAHGPDGAWTCDQGDCGYVVRGGDESDRQIRIEQHFAEHEQQATRVNLAVSESRGQLPINHLLEKIKNIGDRTQQAERSVLPEGTALPQHIKRKVIA